MREIGLKGDGKDSVCSNHLKAKFTRLVDYKAPNDSLNDRVYKEYTLCANRFQSLNLIGAICGW
jgi:hypothetical protein